MLAKRPLLLALALSLVAHLGLLATTGQLWDATPQEIAFPIEASLVPAIEAPPVAKVPEPALALRPPAPVRPLPAKPVAVPPPTLSEPVSEPVTREIPVPVIETPPAHSEPVHAAAAEPERPAAEVEARPAAEPAARPEPKPEPRPARPLQRRLPDRLEIRYAVQYGEAGFVAGEARYTWQHSNGRYALASTIEAKGLASLFVSGKLVQVSEGEVNAGGIQPAEYWENKGERRQPPARFLWPENQLQLSGQRGSVALIAQAQDLLSFPFQLAMTLREDEAAFSMAVTNGRKLQTYYFRRLGEERLNLPGRSVDTVHLQGGREGPGSLDVWLDRNAAYLPVQVRTLDPKGKQITLVAEEVVAR